MNSPNTHDSVQALIFCTSSGYRSSNEGIISTHQHKSLEMEGFRFNNSELLLVEAMGGVDC